MILDLSQICLRYDTKNLFIEENKAINWTSVTKMNELLINTII